MKTLFDENGVCFDANLLSDICKMNMSLFDGKASVFVSKYNAFRGEFCLKRMVDCNFTDIEISVLQNGHCQLRSKDYTFYNDYLPDKEIYLHWDSISLWAIEKYKKAIANL